MLPTFPGKLYFLYKVGLGTDASAGYSPSMLDAMRQAVAVSTHVHLGDPGHRPLDFADAMYLATRGSAAAVALEEVKTIFPNASVQKFSNCFCRRSGASKKGCNLTL